ncbi:MAG: rhodanese-like domain-containing protein [Bdellovibrionia bacterium]
MKKIYLTILALTMMFTQSSLAEADYVLVDVRTPQEYQQKHLSGAQNIDFYSPNFATSLKALDKNKEYKIYCRSGNRSGQAIRLMKELGFSKVEDVGSLEQAQSRLKRQCKGAC